MPREERSARGGSRDRDERRSGGGRGDRDRGGGRDRDRGSGRDRGGDRGGRDRGGRDSGRGQVRRSGGSSFKYQERSVDQIRRQAERQTGRFDSPVKKDVDIWRPQGGDNLIRYLPPTWENPEHYAYKVWVHKYIGADSSTYLCPRKMLGKPCAICDAAREAADAGEQEEAKELSVVPNWVAWILDREGDDPHRPQVFFMSDYMDKDIVSLTYNGKRGDSLQVDHPEMGYDLSMRRTGAGFKTRYSGYQFDREASPIDDDPEVMEEILEFITENPIPSILNYYDNSYLEQVVSGTTESRDEGDDDDAGDDDDETGDEAIDTGRGGRRPLRARGGRAADPDPDDDPPADDDDPPFDPDDEPATDDDAGPEDDPADDDPPEDDRRGGGRDRGGRDRDRGSSRSGGRDRGEARSGRGSGRERGGRTAGRRFRD